MTRTEKIVNLAFREITEKGFFDIEKGNLPIPAIADKEMSCIPGEMTNYIKDCGYGCCFVFSAYVLNILEKYGINAYMVTSLENGGMRASILYEDDGVFYIANPVEDIEFFTENNISTSDRCDYYLGDTCTMVINGEKHNDSRFTIDEFSRKYGQLWVLGKMSSNESISLNQAMRKRLDNCIAPPDKANINIQSLLLKK